MGLELNLLETGKLLVVTSTSIFLNRSDYYQIPSPLIFEDRVSLFNTACP